MVVYCVIIFIMESSSTPNSSPDNSRNVSALEKTPNNTSLEYYKAKNNPISRHVEDLLPVILHKLTYFDNPKYGNNASFASYNIFDGMKKLLQASYLNEPNIQEQNANAHPGSYMGQIERMDNEESKNFFARRNNEEAMYSELEERIRRGEIPGLYMANTFNLDAIATISKTEEVSVRINIKVNSKTTHSEIIRQLANLFRANEDLLLSGFQIKTLDGDNDIRDGVIVYLPDASFKNASEIIVNLFKNDDDYTDRHTEPGIMFGTALETDDGIKLNGIRVTEQPVDHTTFNAMQAQIVSEAVYSYVMNEYSGNKNAMLEDFAKDYTTAFNKWEKEFPEYYEKSAKETVGENANLHNISFLSRK